MSDLYNSIKTELKFFFRYGWRKIQNPVFIYQMGKVASSSIYFSLKKIMGDNIFHVHYLNPENIDSLQKEYIKSGNTAQNLYDGLYLYNRFFKDKKKSLKIISIVREPISRNISAFFQNLSYYSRVHSSYDFDDVQQMMACFLDTYSHNVPLDWFDAEFKSITGIDIYSYPFPKEQGYVVINSDPYQILILKHDLSDNKKSDCISKFLELESFQISRVNEATSKTYFDEYKYFTDSISLPENYIQKMLSSKYSKHFYSSKELSETYDKWARSSSLHK